MKNFLNRITYAIVGTVLILGGLYVGISHSSQFIAGAIGISVPSAPGSNYSLISTSTGAYMSALTVLNATTYPGADIGEKINNAYAALPSTGGQIFVPRGNYSFTTPILFTTQYKVVKLMCESGGGGVNFSLGGGTILTYTPSTGNAITVNTNNYVVAGSGMENCDVQGTGGTSLRTTIGLKLGGTAGAFSFAVKNSLISGFGTAYDLFQNTSFDTIDTSVFNFNGRNIFQESTSGANGENFRVSNSVMADGNWQGGGATDKFCVWLHLSGNVQGQFTGNSFDDCQIYLDQSGGTANITHLTNNHFENPNGDAYDYIVTLSNQPALTVVSTGNDYMNDVVGGMTEFVINGGNFISQGDTVNINNNVTSPVTRFVSNLNATAVDTVSWSGLTQGYANTSSVAAITYVYGTVPYSPSGYGTGSGLSFQMTSSGFTNMANLSVVGNSTTTQLNIGNYQTVWNSGPDYLDTKNDGLSNPFTETRLLSNLASAVNGAESTNSMIVDCSGQGLFNNQQFFDHTMEVYQTSNQAILRVGASGTCVAPPLIIGVVGAGLNKDRGNHLELLLNGTTGVVNNATSSVPTSAMLYVASSTATQVFEVDSTPGTANALGTPLLTILPNGSVGIGTSTPQSRLQISAGASATTTVTVGELGLSSSKACVNMKASDGSASSFYISAAHVLVVEANYCR